MIAKEESKLRPMHVGYYVANTLFRDYFSSSYPNTIKFEKNILRWKFKTFARLMKDGSFLEQIESVLVLRIGWVRTTIPFTLKTFGRSCVRKWRFSSKRAIVLGPWVNNNGCQDWYNVYSRKPISNKIVLPWKLLP